MKVAIIDNRVGNVLREEHGEKLLGADLVLYIQPDNHVDVQVPIPENWGDNTVEAVYIEAVHRDVISGETSAEVNDRRVESREEIEASHAPLDKVARAWEGDSNSGTEAITGPGQL